MTVVPIGCDLARNDLSRVTRDRERVTLASSALTLGPLPALARVASRPALF